MKQKTLEKFLKGTIIYRESAEFVKNLTLEQFLNTCPRGDWILWLFAQTNPENLRELTLAKAHCAATVKHLMTDARSLKALEVAERFGMNQATLEELDIAAYHAYAVRVDELTYDAASAAAAAADTNQSAAYLVAEAAADAYDAAHYVANARERNRKLTADICRKYLPLEIWDQSKL